MTCPNTLLRKVFGFDSFRPGQQEIVDAVVAGEPVLAIMPTGGGKSLCFQLPALARSGLTLVISPLIALMRDQVRALQAAGVCAGALTSANSQEESEEVLAALRDERLRLLYLAPERLASSAMQSLLKRSNVSLIAVDEAHCVSQWGHDFRPDYRYVGRFILEWSPDDKIAPILCLTATAKPDVIDDIIPLEQQETIKNYLFDGRIPWYYAADITDSKSQKEK